MVTVTEFEAGNPPAIGLPLHRCRIGLPVVEIADQRNLLCRWRVTKEAGVMEVSPCGIARQRGDGVGFGEHTVKGFPQDWGRPQGQQLQVDRFRPECRKA